ncbi:hypothetical protein RCL1_003594 [Eukaryota sp. TZLM3-RCL]
MVPYIIVVLFIVSVIVLAWIITPVSSSGEVESFVSVKPSEPSSKPSVSSQATFTQIDKSSNKKALPSNKQTLPSLFQSQPLVSDDEDQLDLPTVVGREAPSLRLSPKHPGTVLSDDEDDTLSFLPPVPVPTLPTFSLNKPIPSLDLSLVSDVKPSSETDRKTTLLASFIGSATEIIPNVFVSGEIPCKDEEMLQSLGITHVLNLAPSVICPKTNHFDWLSSYHVIDLLDSPSQDILSILFDTNSFIASGLASNGKVLVHCHQGVSRSCAIVIAFIMLKLRFSYDDAYKTVKEKRKICSPNAGFAYQLSSTYHEKLQSLDYNLESMKRTLEVKSQVENVSNREQESCQSIQSKTKSKLTVFSWPDFEPIPMFDADDLQDNCVFVLVRNDRGIVWVGSSCEEVSGEDVIGSFVELKREYCRLSWTVYYEDDEDDDFYSILE